MNDLYWRFINSPSEFGFAFLLFCAGVGILCVCAVQVNDQRIRSIDSRRKK